MFNLLANLARVVIAPIEVVAVVANAAVQPVAELAEDLVKDIKDAVGLG